MADNTVDNDVDVTDEFITNQPFCDTITCFGTRYSCLEGTGRISLPAAVVLMETELGGNISGLINRMNESFKQDMSTAKAVFCIKIVTIVGKIISELDATTRKFLFQDIINGKAKLHFNLAAVFSDLLPKAKDFLASDVSTNNLIATVNKYTNTKEMSEFYNSYKNYVNEINRKWTEYYASLRAVVKKEEQNFLEFKERRKARLTGGSHIAGHNRPAAITASGERAYCKFFGKQGGCKSGAECNFRHDAPTSDTSQTDCRFGSKCNKGTTCKFFHPAAVAVDKGNAN
jgi:hypothetical protein